LWVVALRLCEGEGLCDHGDGRDAAHHDRLGAERLGVVLEGRFDLLVDDLESLDHVLELAFHCDHALHVHADVVNAGDGDSGLGLFFDRVDDVALFADDAADVVVVCEHLEWNIAGFAFVLCVRFHDFEDLAAGVDAVLRLAADCDNFLLHDACGAQWVASIYIDFGSCLLSQLPDGLATFANDCTDGLAWD